MNAFSSNPAGQAEVFQRLRDDRQANIRLVALLITLLLHGLVFWWGMNSARFSAPSQEKMQAIRVFLQPLELPRVAAPPRPACAKPMPTASPTAAPPVMPLPRDAALAPPSVVSAPPPSPCPVVTVPETVSSPAVVVSMAPLPVAASVAAPATPPDGAIGAGNKAAPVATTTNGSSGIGQIGVANPTSVAVAGNGNAGTAKELYLRALFAHIEAHKFYPPSARRRQLEGQVRVSFTIDAGGGVSDLKVSEGHPQLEEAALQTVRSALPLPLPAGGVTLPFSLSYHMDFRLR